MTGGPMQVEQEVTEETEKSTVFNRKLSLQTPLVSVPSLFAPFPSVKALRNTSVQGSFEVHGRPALGPALQFH